MNTPARKAVLYRMATPTHTCPFGLKSRALLRSRGFEVEDHKLTSREAIDAFKAEHGVKTTPQTFIDGRRIGGHEDLRRHLGLKIRDKSKTTYTPVFAVFAVAALMAVAATYVVDGATLSWRALYWFVAFAMCLLAMLKLRDLDSFSNMFLGYDLLAKRWVGYSYLYPFGELAAGVLMIAGVLVWVSAPLALFIGGVGAVSVIKAVYIDKRELKCACVGGDSNVPLGFISLTENLAMIAMGAWMLAMELG